MHELLQVPFEAAVIMAKKKRIKRELLAKREERIPCNIAIMGGSTTAPVKDALELFLLDKGVAPNFYESEYNKWYEDIMFNNDELNVFKPRIVYIHTSFVNLTALPEAGDSKETIESKLNETYAVYEKCWNKITNDYGAMIIQNNIELPDVRHYGNIDASEPSGVTYFIDRLNQKFAGAAQAMSNLFIQDIRYLSADYGLSRWYDREFYALYKVAMASEAIPYLALNLASMIGSLLGRSKKCLVLDLDNTLWGGIVSEDGVEKLSIGHETALGESFLAWQEYILHLQKRGIILAVCSKNDLDIAKSGFTHPDCLLKPEDFIAFHANWESKSHNISQIAEEINIGLDSLVFIDDNPAERAIVREQLPMVTVPEVKGGEPFSYIRAIEDGKYFEVATISEDDYKRNQTYQQNKQRQTLELNSSSYDEFLKGLEMKAYIRSFEEVYIPRIAQLTNKSNQFNLTTRRYTEEEIRQISRDDHFITLYGRLVDRYGDNGVVSVVIGEIKDKELHIQLWLMSCRVLKRNMEYAMLDELMHRAQAMGIKKVIGYYIPTKKNKMVCTLLNDFCFRHNTDKDGMSIWEFNLLDKYKDRNTFIEVLKDDVM